MRCRACDKKTDVAWWYPDDAAGPVLETLCPSCLFFVRAMLYDGGPDNEIETLTMTLGIDSGHSDSTE